MFIHFCHGYLFLCHHQSYFCLASSSCSAFFFNSAASYSAFFFNSAASYSAFFAAASASAFLFFSAASNSAYFAAASIYLSFSSCIYLCLSPSSMARSSSIYYSIFSKRIIFSLSIFLFTKTAIRSATLFSRISSLYALKNIFFDSAI
jgi:hypothetical protein